MKAFGDKVKADKSSYLMARLFRQLCCAEMIKELLSLHSSFHVTIIAYMQGGIYKLTCLRSDSGDMPQ